MIHIMLDLETWGTEPGCDIRSIGACVFDPVRGKVADQNTVRESDFASFGTFYIACDNPAHPDLPGDMYRTYTYPSGEQWYHDGIDQLRKYPLHRDPSTVQWWSEQSDEAQAAFADPVDLRDALGRFGDWIAALRSAAHGEDRVYLIGSTDAPPDDIRLWSHGPAFDPPILAAAYRAVGLPVPWHYRAPRDTRTAFDMAGIDDHSAWLAQHSGSERVQHHALSDAICQARAVCGAWDVVQQWHAHSGIS